MSFLKAGKKLFSYFVIIALITTAFTPTAYGAPPTDLSVTLNILNTPGDFGIILVSGKDVVSVKFILYDPSGESNINDYLQLVQVSTGEIVTTVNKGQSSSNTISLSTTANNALGELKVEYVHRASGTIMAEAPVRVTVVTDALIKDLMTRVVGLETLPPRVTTNEAGIAANTSAITANDADILANATGITANSGLISRNAFGITTNATDINTNAAGISANASGLSALDGRVTTNEAGITGLDTRVSALETAAPALADQTCPAGSIITGFDANSDVVCTPIGGTGKIKTFGWNLYGQLGDGTNTQRWTPVSVTGLSGVTDISAGGFHTVALKDDGTVWAWGWNWFGQLGDGTKIQRLTPVQVRDPVSAGFLTGVTDISAGGYHTLALKDDGTVWAWGGSSDGQLGDGTYTQRLKPVQVVDSNDSTGFFTGVTAISAGDSHSLALKNDGTVWAWGNNYYGQLGDGGSNSYTPLQVVDTNDPTGFLTGVKDISGGFYHTVALKDNGTVWAWGNNKYGQLGDRTNITRETPVQVVDAYDPTGFLTGITDIALGDYHTVALKDDGTVWAWGGNKYGQLGDGTNNEGCRKPAQVIDPNDPAGFLTNVKDISGGFYHTVALKDDGTVWAWGNNGGGQLGDGMNTQRWKPVQVIDPDDPAGFLTDVTTITAGGYHTVVIYLDPVDSLRGPKGPMGPAGTPGADGRDGVDGADGILSLTGKTCPKGSYMAGFDAVGDLICDSIPCPCPVTTKVWAWGWNEFGQLGDGTTTDRWIPVDLPGLTGVTAISGGFHSLALKDDGTVWAWGGLDEGRSTPPSNVPVPVAGLTGVTAISGGYNHSLALKDDGTVWAWGENYDGQLGDRTNDNKWTPVQVVDPNDPTGFLTNVKDIAAGGFYSLALKYDGTVWAWGGNSEGQLGDGTNNEGWRIPVQVVDAYGLTGFLTNVKDIVAGYSHSLALKYDGTVWAWGWNSDGQLGDGTNTQRWTPVPVLGLTGFLTGVTAIAAGYSHSLVLKDDGTVWALASGEGEHTTSNNVLLPVTGSLPAPVTGLAGVTAISAGDKHSLALKDDGTIWAWGDNGYGQLGDGTNNPSNVPVPVTGPTGFLTGVTAISGGGSYSLAITK
jgi:alpha-tubulin suppressor-like RCC1 family protein